MRPGRVTFGCTTAVDFLRNASGAIAGLELSRSRDAWAGYFMHYGMFYYAGLVVSAGFMLYHYTLIRDRNRAGCFKAFLHNNWVGGAISLGLIAEFHLRSWF